MLEGSAYALRRTRDALADTGELGNTYIVFTSDNGRMLGEHRIPAGKALPYEEAIHVPLVITGPGVPKRTERSELVANNDLAPTMAEWAGVEAPEVDGRSLVPLLSRATVEGWRSALLSEHPGSGQRRPGHAVLITPNVRYIEWTTGERELYDLSTDPHQLNNIVAKTDPETLSEYSRRLKALEICAADSCRTAEGAP